MSWHIIKALLLFAPCAVFLFELSLLWLTLRPKRRTVAWLVLFGFVASYKFFGFKLFGGDEFNPILPYWIVVGWDWLESVVWVALPCSVVAALIAWAVRPFRRFAFRTVVLSSLVLATYGMWEGMRVPPVVEHDVVIDGLPSAFDGYRIAHLSDLHCSSAARRDKLEEIVKRTNAARPDLVAITGDIVDGFPARRKDDLEPLKDLRAKDGAFLCAGNHENYFRIAWWEPYYAQWGLTVLRNDWSVIPRGDAKLVIGGIDDASLGDEPELVFQGAPTNTCRILLQHRPTDCRRNERCLDARLQLSGHTHGGAMPIFSHFVALKNEGHVRGFYREGKLLLHVSPGTGQWAGFPLRFFNPPEITVLTLRPGH